MSGAAGPATVGNGRTVPIETGAFIAVVGPSGAGKDSLIDYARRHFCEDSRVHFVRRVVTRGNDAGNEDHESIGDDVFDRARAAGGYAFSWLSHGLRYGIPVEVDRILRSGGVAVANLSRNIVPLLSARYADSSAVLVTAAPDVLLERLHGRGRESRPDIARRMARNADYAGQNLACDVIDNSGPLERAGEIFVALIRRRLETCRR